LFPFGFGCGKSSRVRLESPLSLGGPLGRFTGGPIAWVCDHAGDQTREARHCFGQW
jgi:hypothetical protein